MCRALASFGIFVTTPKSHLEFGFTYSIKYSSVPVIQCLCLEEIHHKITRQATFLEPSNLRKENLRLTILLLFIVDIKLNSMYESDEILSLCSLRRTSSVPKDMHLIFRKQSFFTKNTSAVPSTPSTNEDPSSFITRVLSDLRESDKSLRDKESSVSSVHTNPGQFMRGMLSDLQEINSSPTTEAHSLMFQNGTIYSVPEFEPRPADDDVLSSFQMSLSERKCLVRGKDKCFSSVSSAKNSTRTGATATMVTDFSGVQSYFEDDEMIRLVPDCEEKTDDDPMDASALAKLRRDRNRSWNFSTINVLQVGRIPIGGNGINGKAQKTTSSSLFGRDRTKISNFSKNSNFVEMALASAISDSFPSLLQPNGRNNSPLRVSKSDSFIEPQEFAVSWNDLKDQDTERSRESDSEATSFVDAKDFECEKKKSGRSLFLGANTKCSNRRSMQERIDTTQENILLRLSLS